MLHVGQEAPGDLHGDLLLTIVLQPLDRHPLQRRPAVGGVPLLAAVDGGGGQPAGFKQARLGGGGHFRRPLA